MKTKTKISFLCGFIVAVSIVIILNVIISRAKYQKTENIKVVSGTINYSVQNVNIIHVKEQTNGEYEDKTTIPKGNYTLNTTSSYCTQKPNTTTHLNGVTFNYNSTSGTIDITGIPTIKVICHLYFDIATTKKVQVAGLTLDVNLDTPDFSKTACDAKTNSEKHTSGTCTSTDKGIYEATDDYGTSYYYRGTVDNNWVKFAGFWWRIIRINGNGSIRLIYSGEASTQPADGRWSDGNNSRLASTSAYKSKPYNDNTYIGYYYGATGASSYSAAHTNATPSTIAGVINNWYTSSGLSSQSAKLDGATGWCNDRTPYAYSGLSATSQPDPTNYGYGTKKTYYGAYFRRQYSHQPTYSCSTNDLFTLTNSGKGNGKLTVPVGLITADEVMFAGGSGANNYGYWLYTENNYWTMSPYCFDSGGANVFRVNSNGYLGCDYVNYSSYDVRPVINLKAGTTFKSGGNGTVTNPYEVS